MLGYGRRDLLTLGVVDNFKSSSSSYTGADLISKPKLKPAPAGSPAALRERGSIVVSDGSGFDFTKGAAAPVGRNAASAPSSVLSSPAPLSSANYLRRSTKNNQTSQSLREVFQYENINNVWNAPKNNNNNAATTTTTQ